MTRADATAIRDGSRSTFGARGREGEGDSKGDEMKAGESEASLDEPVTHKIRCLTPKFSGPRSGSAGMPR